MDRDELRDPASSTACPSRSAGACCRNGPRPAPWASAALLSLALLLAGAATLSGCQRRCTEESCSGCCTAEGKCVSGGAAEACGTAGGACLSCLPGGACVGGVCDGGTARSAGGPPDDPWEPTPQRDGGAAGQGRDAGVDAGADAGRPPCARDDDCRGVASAEGVGRVCVVRSGLCVAGRGCGRDSDCQSEDVDDPCFRYGTQCRCDFADARDAGAQPREGTCRRRRAPCEPCADDSECGADAYLFGPPGGQGAGRCVALRRDAGAGGGSGRFCVYQRVGECACGTVDHGDGYCRPQSESCERAGCNRDSDCPGGTVCTVRNAGVSAGACGGLCVPRCRWSFARGELEQPGCRPGETCWVDDANLAPSSKDFGWGRCRPPCAGDAECASSSANPFGGARLRCAGERQRDGGSSAPRCRAKGACMDDLECPEPPLSEPSTGYCDRRDFTCRADCRTGVDPTTGNPFDDCRAPYTCALGSSGRPFCRLQSCVEQGGAMLACARGQYCCGDDKDGDGRADPCPPPERREPSGCYDAPRPPFCTPCNGDEACAALPAPDYLSGEGACANGSLAPSCSPLPPKCVPVSERLSVCSPPTWNALASTRLAQRGCPVGYQLAPVRPALVDDYEHYCLEDAHCNLGTDAGRCGADPTLRSADGGPVKVCLCEGGSGSSQCPNDAALNLASECRAAPDGEESSCVTSVVCTPPPSSLTEPPGAPTYGCGL